MMHGFAGTTVHCFYVFSPLNWAICASNKLTWFLMTASSSSNDRLCFLLKSPNSLRYAAIEIILNK